jgi:threonine dehydrogenase-like Zn-dependent dehydrogenase
MEARMLQARWTETGIGLQDIDPGPLRSGFVRLRVTACGICGSDLHRYRDPASPLGRQVTPGHEMVGTIMDGGDTGLPDALYGVDPWQACGRCDFCLRGRSESCRNGLLAGVFAPGGLGEFFDAPVTNVHAIDPSLSSLEASINEPFAVCVRTIHLAELKLDSRVLVIGGGTLGLICGALARDTAGRVAVTTRYAHQAEAARKIGVENVAEAETDAFAADFEPDVVIESVGGTAGTIEQAMNAARVGGTVVVQGLFTENVAFDPRALVFKELHIIGSKIYGRSARGPEFATATALLPRYRDEISALQTHQFPLTRVEEAFAVAADRATPTIKVTVESLAYP